MNTAILFLNVMSGLYKIADDVLVEETGFKGVLCIRNSHLFRIYTPLTPFHFC